MSAAIFFEALRSRFRSSLFWGMGMAGLAIYIQAAIPNQQALDSYASLLEMMPEELFHAIGASDVASLTTPEGFIGFGVFAYASLFLAVYAVSAGLSITANEEHDGTLDILLSLPVERWQVILEKFAANVLLMILVALMMFAGIFIGGFLTEYTLDMGRMLEASLNIVPIQLLIMGVTALFSALFSGRRIPMALAAVFVVGSYFLDFLGSVASQSFLAEVKRLSVFNYYNGQAVVMDGLVLSNIVLLLGLSIVAVAAASLMFQRRDVA